MKIIFILCLLCASYIASAQSAAEVLANKIARKMKDSLDLTEQQKSQLYTINMQLHQQKQAMFSRYRGTDSLRIQIQFVENTRDTLYSTVLSQDKYLLYKQKKRNLVNND